MISVHIATVQDIHVLSFLGATTFAETYKNMGQGRPEGLEEMYGKTAFAPGKLKEELTDPDVNKRPVYHIAEVSGQPAGYSKIKFDTPPDCVPNRKSAYEDKIYILKNFQKQGVGKALTEAIENEILKRGFTGIWLGVWDQNPQAIAYHKKMGFRIVGSQEWKFECAEMKYVDTDLVMYRDLEMID